MLFLVQIISQAVFFHGVGRLLFIEQRQQLCPHVVFNGLPASLGKYLQFGALGTRNSERNGDLFLFFFPPMKALPGVIECNFSQKLAHADIVLLAVRQNQLLLLRTEISI